MDANADRLVALLTGALTEAACRTRVHRAGNMLSVFFGDSAPTNFASAKATETVALPGVLPPLLDAGVYPPCSAFETWFVSTALDDDAFDRIAAALPARAPAAAPQARQ